jgi:hypothetical protein
MYDARTNSPIRWPPRSGPTSAPRCAVMSSRGRCASPRPRPSASPSPCSIQPPGDPLLTVS